MRLVDEMWVELTCMKFTVACLMASFKKGGQIKLFNQLTSQYVAQTFYHS